MTFPKEGAYVMKHMHSGINGENAMVDSCYKEMYFSAVSPSEITAHKTT